MTSVPIVTSVRFLQSFYVQKKPVEVPGRRFYSLTLRKSGRVRLWIDGKELISKEKMITYVPAGVSYLTEIIEPGEMEVMHFSLLSKPAQPYAEPFVGYAEDLSGIYQRAIRCFSENAADPMCFSYAYELLSRAFSSIDRQIILPPPALMHCKEYIDSHIADPDLRISKLAQMRGVSEVYFRREFKRFYFVSPLEYIKRKRIEQGAFLLSMGIYSVTEVATLAGFDSISYFSSEFRRLHGISPTQYMKKKG